MTDWSKIFAKNNTDACSNSKETPLWEMSKKELNKMLDKTAQLLEGKTLKQLRLEQREREKKECQLLEKIVTNLMKIRRK